MGEINLPEELANKLVDEVIAMSEKGFLKWKPYSMFGHFGYLSDEYYGFRFYVHWHFISVNQYDLFVIEGNPPDIEGHGYVYTRDKEKLYNTAKRHARHGVNVERLKEVMNLRESDIDPFLSCPEQVFLSDQYSPGTFKYFDSDNELHVKLYRKGYIAVGSGGLGGLISLTEAGRIVGKKCHEELKHG